MRSAPGLAKPTAPQPPKPVRRIEERPHHAAVAGPPPTPAPARPARPEPEDSGRWSVIDLTSATPVLRPAEMGASMTAPAARESSPSPTQRLDPLSYLDRPMPASARTAERAANNTSAIRTQYRPHSTQGGGELFIAAQGR